MKFFTFIFLFLTVVNYSKGQSYTDEAAKIAFGFYSTFMSPVKDPVSQCQFHPSCSQFGHQSFKKYGAVKGMLLTADRYMRCSGGVNISGKYPGIAGLFYDPPECNYLFGDHALWHLSSSITNNYVSGAPSSRKKENNKFGFTKDLFLEGDFQNSVLELKRIRYNSNDKFTVSKSNLLISVNHIVTDKLNRAVSVLENIEADKDFLYEYFILQFTISDKQTAYNWNRNFIKKHSSKIEDSVIVPLTLYNEFKSENFVKCRNIAKNSTLEELNKTINKNLAAYNDISFKSPFLAGIMSTVLPGAGYVYTGSFKEGLSAFMINSLLGAGIYSLFTNDNTGSGILLSAVSAPFYFGNIVGSANSARLYNQQRKDKVFRQLRNDLGITYYFSTSFYIDLFDK